MKYKLLKNGQGILVERTTIMRDIKDSFELSFLLPESGLHIAVFKDNKGIDYKRQVREGSCEIPAELFKSNQYVELIVCRMDGAVIVESWVCEPLYISSFYLSQKSQWQVSGGMTEEGALKRIGELERTMVLFEEAFIALKGKTEELEKIVDELKQKKVIM